MSRPLSNAFPSLPWGEDLIQIFLIGGFLGEPQRSQSSGLCRVLISILFRFRCAARHRGLPPTESNFLPFAGCLTADSHRFASDMSFQARKRVTGLRGTGHEKRSGELQVHGLGAAGIRLDVKRHSLSLTEGANPARL